MPSKLKKLIRRVTGKKPVKKKTKTAKKSTKKKAGKKTTTAKKKAGKKTTKKAGKNATKKPAKKAAKSVKKRTRKSASKKPTRRKTVKAAKKPARRKPAKTAKKKAGKKTTKKAAKKKTVKKPKKKAAKKTGKKATKKPIKKTKKKAAKKTPKRVAKKKPAKTEKKDETKKPVKKPKKKRQEEKLKYKPKKKLDSVSQSDPRKQPWNPQRSKIKAAIENGLPESYFHVRRMLYIGAAHGYTISQMHTLPIELYAIEKSREMMQHFLPVAENLPNVLPVFGDAAMPDSYAHLVPYKVDLVFQDIAQKDQVGIFLRNCELFLATHGVGLLCLKARNIDSTAEPASVFAEARERLEAGRATIVQELSLEPFHEGHRLFVVHMNPLLDW